MNNTYKFREKLDREEQEIYNAFSDISVDTQSLKNKISRSKRYKKRNFRPLIAAASILIFIGLSGTVYGLGGGLDNFLNRFQPPFMEFPIAPLYPAYAQDQGIRIEVLGAQQFGNIVLLHYTIQDITGENRLTRYMWADFYLENDPGLGGAGSRRRLNFDSATNTVYFESIIRGDLDTPVENPLEIVATDIMDTQFAGRMQTLASGEWRMQVNTEDTSFQVIDWHDITIQEGQFYIEHMRLTPMGVQILATTYDPNVGSSPTDNLNVTIETTGRNIRPRTASGGFWQTGFDMFMDTQRPVPVEDVTAIIVNGTRVPTP